MKLTKILISLILISCFVSALDIPSYKDKYINDFAEIFSQDQVLYVRDLLLQVEKNTTAEVSVVTIPECVVTASEYSNKLFNQWKIGKENKDNGLLILYCKTENKIWVETGYGLEGILPDSKLGRMLDDYYVPLRDSGNATQGIISFTENVAKIIKENELEVIEETKPATKGIIIFIIILICFIIFVIIIANRKKCPRCGKKLKKINSDLDYTYYKCENNHKHKIKNPSRNWFIIHTGGIGGGFGRGGFGGGGFGGGFGGGASGGGGAGR